MVCTRNGSPSGGTRPRPWRSASCSRTRGYAVRRTKRQRAARSIQGCRMVCSSIGQLIRHAPSVEDSSSPHAGTMLEHQGAAEGRNSDRGGANVFVVQPACTTQTARQLRREYGSASPSHPFAHDARFSSSSGTGIVSQVYFTRLRSRNAGFSLLCERLRVERQTGLSGSPPSSSR
jgi:hypothetical protein